MTTYTTYTNAEKIAFRKALPKKYWSAGALIPDTQGQYLLVHDHQGRWNVVGGLGDAGETLLETLYREMQEEIGLQLPVQQLLVLDDKQLMIDDYCDESWHTLWLTAPITEEQKASIRIDHQEILDYGFFPWEKCLARVPDSLARRLTHLTPSAWGFVYLENEELPTHPTACSAG
ncbi:NUDIX hydrolase [Candidatus Peribacteria bacterium]|nr:NUDIX hydrolase [Candidatus Peribacteria bacterium]